MSAADPALEAAKAYSERYMLKDLLAPLDLTDVLPQPDTVVVAGSSSSGSGSGKDASSSGTGAEESAGRSLYALYAEALAAQGLPSTTDATAPLEPMFGGFREDAKAAGALAAGAATVPRAACTTPAILVELYAALAHHYAAKTTGGGGAAASQRAVGQLPLHEGVPLALQVAKTLRTAAAAFYCAHVHDGSSDAAAGVSCAELFLSRLIGSSGGVGAAQRAADVGFLFAVAHLPALTARGWGKFRDIAQQTHTAAAAARDGAEGPQPLRPMDAETVVLRCLVVVLCEAALTPVLREAKADAEAGRPLGPVAASLLLPRVRAELRRVSAALAAVAAVPETNRHHTALCAVFSDALFVRLLRPHPSIVASHFLTSSNSG